jgi:hypothetical protein
MASRDGTINRSDADFAALEAIDAERATPVRIRQFRYLNNWLSWTIGRSSVACDPCWDSRLSLSPDPAGRNEVMHLIAKG